MEIRQSNPFRVTAMVWWIITAVTVCGIVMPPLISVNVFSSLYFRLTAFVCLILAVAGIIMAIKYTIRAGKLDRILKGEDVLLAHWTYSPEEWQLYTEEEFVRQKAGIWLVFIAVVAVVVVGGFVSWYYYHTFNQSILIILACIIILSAFLILFPPYYNYRQNKKVHGQAFFTKDALYLNGQLHVFKGLGTKLEKTEIKGDRQQYVEFIYCLPAWRTGRRTRSTREARAPVPRGKEADARDLVAKYSG